MTSVPGSRVFCDLCGALMSINHERYQLRVAEPYMPFMKSQVVRHFCCKCGRAWLKAQKQVVRETSVVIDA